MKYIHVLRHLSSRQIAIFSLLLWVSALFFTGFTLYGGRKLSGLGIFLSGWLGPLDLNFTWYANIFYFFALLGLLQEKSIRIKSIVIAVLLTMNLFTFNTLLLDEGGGKGYVYGYGIGSIMWLLSIYMLLIASGTRLMELKDVSDKSNTGDTYYLRYIGISLVSITIIMSMLTSIYVRSVANQSEMKRLSHVLFKRGPVCSTEEPLPKRTIHLKGVLEIVNSDNRVYPFTSPKTLLKWGVPIVRMNGLDYSYKNIGEEWVLIAKEATGKADATLIARASALTPKYPVIRITLKTNNENLTDNENILFYKSWKPEGDTRIYCPDYSPFPGLNDEPAKIVSSALSLERPEKLLNYLQTNRREYPNITAKIIDIHSSTNSEKHEKCSEKHIVLKKNKNHPELWLIAPAFLDEDTYYFTDMYHEGINFYCDKNYIYLYRSIAPNNDGTHYKLVLEKREKKNFLKLWTYWIVVPEQYHSYPDEDGEIVSISENNDSIVVNFFDKKKENIITIKAFKNR